MDRLCNAFLDYLTVERGLAANTIAAYRRDVARYLAYSQDVCRISSIDEIEADDVLDHLVMLRESGMATRSIARHLASIRMFHRYIQAEGFTPI